MNKFLLVLLGALALGGCYYDNEEELYPRGAVNDSIPVTYTSDIASIVNGNCAIGGCHVAGAQPPDLSDYAKLKANIDRVKVRAIDQKTMPPTGPLSNANIARLQKWIDNGMPN